tara:strand:+ start:1421 stop:1555 length:135 start_codon:yes stop_codon:yes gene_type:complete
MKNSFKNFITNISNQESDKPDENVLPTITARIGKVWSLDEILGK